MPHPISPLQAADLSAGNRDALEVFADAGCYFCLRTFRSDAVVDFATITRPDDTAVCPHCSVDAVLPGITDKAILKQCHKYWFCNDADPAAQD